MGGVSKKKIMQGALSSAAQAGTMYLAYEGAQALDDAITGNDDDEWIKQVMEGVSQKKAESGEWWMSEEWIVITCGLLVLAGLITTPLGMWCVKRKWRGEERRDEREDEDIEMADRNEEAE